MGKKLIITEKPSVAREFAKALKEQMKSYTGYMESEGYIITWCVGHLVMLSYPEAYDESYRRWSLDTIPFIPETYKYEVIENVKKQFEIVKMLFHREDVDVIYNAGDSGREGEYIQRLVLQEAGYNKKAELRRIWIDSQTEEEILRGIKEAKDMSAYDNLS
ncbi:MAG: toprim domain-containing protein, partial [Lachnospiraceae bacterium]